MSGIRPDMSETDVLKHVLSQKGLSYEKKLNATSAINQVLEQTRKRQREDRLFGGDAQRNDVDNVNVQGDMNHQPPGVSESSMGDMGASENGITPNASIGAPRNVNQQQASPFSGNPRHWRDQDIAAYEAIDYTNRGFVLFLWNQN